MDFILTEPTKNRMWTKISHLQTSNMPAPKAHLLAVTRQFQAPHSKGLGKNGDSLKFILTPQGKSTVIESKGFTTIPSFLI